MSSITGLFLMLLLSISCSIDATEPSIDVVKLLEGVVSAARASKQEISSSYEELDAVEKENRSKDETNYRKKPMASEATATNDEKMEDKKQKELTRLARHRVFQEYCAQAVPKTGDLKQNEARTLELLSSHIFPACLTYECRWLWNLPDPMCDAISRQAKILRKKAKKQLHIQGLRKRAADVLYILG